MTAVAEHPAEPLVSVLIPAKDAAQWIPEQLAALDDQVDAPPFEVVIADNGSTDGTPQAALAGAHAFTVRVVNASGPSSASHGRNMAARAARGRILLFCDADDFVGDRWVGELYRAVTSGSQLVARGVLEHSRFNDVDVLAAYRIDPAQDLHDTEDSPRIETVSDGFAGYLATVPGNNFAIRRADYLKLGGMDPAYPGGSEETDFVWRAQEAGFTVVQAAGAVVYYRLRTTPAAIFRQQRNQQRGRMYLWTRYRDRGMSGPSVKASVFAISRHMPMWPLLRRDRGRALAWAHTVGAHVGALEGMARYRRPALLRSRRPGSDGGTAA
ncbi:glycosyltransferase family 2 protein [Micrococcus luteus]|uniref:glycosyltransferase family 2 protein n=1 Tax=Micrococcus luteus TaxID=1270 RepID=UPI001303E938|nr:glycosyltransferase family A protein [Micrococcus luteus]